MREWRKNFSISINYNGFKNNKILGECSANTNLFNNNNNNNNINIKHFKQYTNSINQNIVTVT